MATPKLRRISFLPLQDAIMTPEMTDEDLAARLGVTRKCLKKYRDVGLTLFKADQMACRLGYHPIFFWGDDYFGPLYENGTDDLLGWLA